MRTLAAVFAWWVFFTAHPTQPFLGPYPTEVTCLRATVAVARILPRHSRLDVDCREFDEVTR